MASFASSAFSTDAFSVLAWDFGGAAPPQPTPEPEAQRPAGGWETGKQRRELFFEPRVWAVRTEAGVQQFDSPEAASSYLAEIKAAEEARNVKKARRIGKAPVVEYAGVPVNDINVDGQKAIQALREMDARRLEMVIRLIERQIMMQAAEEEEMLLMLAALQ